MSITLAQLQNRVATALSSELGTRTYGTTGHAQTVQALVIDNGSTAQVVGGHTWYQQPEKVTGLEAVIEPEVNSQFRPLLNGDYYLTHTTRITLKQWDPTDTIQTARGLLIAELKNIIDQVGPRVPRNSRLKSVEQISFTIFNPSRT